MLAASKWTVTVARKTDGANERDRRMQEKKKAMRRGALGRLTRLIAKLDGAQKREARPFFALSTLSKHTPKRNGEGVINAYD